MYFHGTLQNIINYSMKSLIYMELNDCLKILLLIHIEFSSKLKVQGGKCFSQNKHFLNEKSAS